MSEIYGEISAAGVILGTLIAQTGAKGETGAPGKDGKDYVLTESDKEEIASMINDDVQSQLDSLSNKNTEQDKNIQKNADDIEKINKKDTTQDNLIEELQAENTKLKKEINSMQIPGEATGNPIHLTDSSDLECEIAVVGNSEQETRSRKNKLQLYFSDKTTSGVTITKNEDDSITLIGTATANINFLNLGKFLYEVAKGTFKGCLTYKSGSMKDGSAGLFFSSSTTSGTNKGGTTLEAKNKSFALSSTVTEDANIYPYIYINSGTTFDNFTFYFQVVNSDTDDFDYEQYGAMPSPDYPSPVETVGQNGSVEIEVCNKNYLGLKDIEENTSNGITYSCKNGVIKLNGTATSSFGIILKHNKFTLFKGIKYVGKMIVTNKPGVNTSVISIRDMNNNSRFYMECWVSPKIIEITPEDNIYFKDDEKTNLWINSGTIFSNTEFIIQIEEGSNATDYIPHESYTKVLHVQKEFVKIGDVEDTFVKVEGKWYEAHYHPKIVFDGTENILFNASDNVKLRVTLQLDNLKENTNQSSTIDVLSNSFKGVSANNATTNLPINSISVISNKRLFIILNISVFSNVETFKTWLAEKYANGAPIIAYPTLKEPELIECTQEQIDILNSFYTYKGITNVSMSGIGTLKVNYKKDLETIINNLSATSVAE